MDRYTQGCSTALASMDLRPGLTLWMPFAWLLSLHKQTWKYFLFSRSEKNFKSPEVSVPSRKTQGNRFPVDSLYLRNVKQSSLGRTENLKCKSELITVDYCLSWIQGQSHWDRLFLGPHSWCWLSAMAYRTLSLMVQSYLCRHQGLSLCSVCQVLRWPV